MSLEQHAPAYLKHQSVKHQNGFAPVPVGQVLEQEFSSDTVRASA